MANNPNDPNEPTAQSRLAELGLSLDKNINWNLPSIFPKVKGMGYKGKIKKKTKLIKQVEPTLKETLKDGEEVLYVAKGIQLKFWEQYFMGVWAQLINQTVFVLTNGRLLMFNTNTKGKPKHSYWMVYFSEIIKFKKRFLGGMTMNLKDKSKFVFAGFQGADKKSMPEIFERINQEYSEMGFSPEVSQSRECLCTVCKQVVPKKVYQCANCGQDYWTPKELGLRSLIFPSWGDWLMGHRLLAFAELAGYLISWIVLATLLFGPKALPLAAGIPLVLFVLFIEHVVDGWLTYAIASKGLVPKKPIKSKQEK